MNKEIRIGNFVINEASPTFIIAEMSANHLFDFDRAVKIIQAAKDAGADAIKIQTYTPDTITLDCDDPCFQITQGTIWDGTTLHKLYESAYTPWEWQPKLKKIAEDMGLIFFSSPFDLTSIDFLEEMNVPVYKVASFEITDIPFIKKIAKTGKPIIMSTGIAYMSDIELAMRTCREAGNENVILLKCTSSYPAPYEDINLKTIPSMKETFDCITGLSDHTMGSAVAGAGVALGAKVVEKHLTLSRADGGADAAFSMEPQEFKEMVDNIRKIEKAVGRVTYDLTDKQKAEREHTRSLFVAQDMKAGDVFTPDNLRSVRPGNGLHTKYYEELLGKKISKDARLGTPMSWDLVDFTGENDAVDKG
jgi:pseudaminic acid synthase